MDSFEYALVDLPFTLDGGSHIKFFSFFGAKGPTKEEEPDLNLNKIAWMKNALHNIEISQSTLFWRTVISMMWEETGYVHIPTKLSSEALIAFSEANDEIGEIVSFKTCHVKLTARGLLADFEKEDANFQLRLKMESVSVDK